MTHTDKPLLISKASAAFELSVAESQIEELVKAGDLVEVELRGQRLIVVETLTKLVSKLRRDAWVERRKELAAR